MSHTTAQSLTSSLALAATLALSGSVTFAGLAFEGRAQGLIGSTGPGSHSQSAPRFLLGEPADPAAQGFTTYTDASGNARSAETFAIGSADFDADGNADFWALGAASGSGSGASDLSIQMARTSDAGRFRLWHTFRDGPWTDGTTYRARDQYDRVALVRPDSDRLVETSYARPMPPRDPRDGHWGYSSTWPIGLGAYEIETFDDGGDRIDDLYFLFDAGNGATRIERLRMTPSPGARTSFVLPVAARRLRVLDLDGNGRGDPVVEVPGVGVLVLRDSGGPTFSVHALIQATNVRDLTTGHVDGDNLGDLALAFDSGLLVYRGGLTTWGSPSHVHGLYTPSPFQSLAGVAIVTAQTTEQRSAVVGIDRDGRGVFAHEFADGKFGSLELSMPKQSPAGTGLRGTAAVTADVDADGDLDLVVQQSDRSGFVAYRNTDYEFEPKLVEIRNLGFVGESGFFRHDLVFELPARARAQGIRDVEFAVFVEDVFQQKWIYWTRRIQPVDAQGRVVFTVYYQMEQPRFRQMLLNNGKSFAGEMTSGGATMFSVHGKESPGPGDNGPVRHESNLVDTPGGDDHKSAVGAQWRFRATPPKPTADTELLPFD